MEAFNTDCFFRGVVECNAKMCVCACMHTRTHTWDQLKGKVQEGDIVWNDGTTSRPMAMLLQTREMNSASTGLKTFHRVFDDKLCHTIRNAFYFGFSLVNGAGIGDPPKSFRARLLLMSLGISCLVFMELYAANMTAIIVDAEPIQFNTDISDWPDLEGKAVGCIDEDWPNLQRELHRRGIHARLVNFSWSSTDDELIFLDALKQSKTGRVESIKQYEFKTVFGETASGHQLDA